jgi:deleted-in-malignant-brain-tumors protein 1
MTHNDTVAVFHSQSSSQLLTVGLESHSTRSYDLPDVIGLSVLESPMLTLTPLVPALMATGRPTALMIDGSGFGHRDLMASLVFTSRPSVGHDILIENLTTPYAFHLNGKKANVVEDRGGDTITVLLAEGKKIDLPPRNLIHTRPSNCNQTCDEECSKTCVPQSLSAANMAECLSRCHTVTWISDTSLAARVMAMPKGKYDLVVSVRNQSSNSVVVESVESWLEIMPRYAALQGQTVITVNGWGFLQTSTYTCEWKVWSLLMNSSANFKDSSSLATVRSTDTLICQSPAWNAIANESRRLWCENYFCEARLSLEVRSKHLGLLPGPVHQKDTYLRILPSAALSLRILVSPTGLVRASATPHFVLAVRDEYGMNVMSNMTLQVKEVTGDEGRRNESSLGLYGRSEVTAVDGVAYFNNLRPAQQAMPYVLQFVALEDGTPLITVSISVPTVPFGQPYRLDVEDQPADADAGTAFPHSPLVAALDFEGNRVLDWSAIVHVQLVPLSVDKTSGEAVLKGPTARQANLSQSATASFGYLSVDRAGLYLLNFSSPMLLPVISVPFEVRHGSAALLYAQFLQWNMTSMMPIGPLHVSVRDMSGNIVPVNISIDVHLHHVNSFYPAYFDNRKGELSGVTEAISERGIAVFDALYINRARSGYVLKMRSGILEGETMVFSVRIGVCHRLSIERQPGAGVAAKALPIQPVVAIFDKGNNTVNISAINVSLLHMNLGSNGLKGNVQGMVRKGVVVFTDLALVQVSTAAVLFFHSSLPCAFSVQSDPFPVIANAPAKLNITQQPYDARGGQPFTDLVTVLILDVGDNIVESGEKEIYVKLTEADCVNQTCVQSNSALDVANVSGCRFQCLKKASLSGSIQESSVKGKAIFTDLSINAVGEYQLTFWSPGLTTAISLGIKVKTGRATHLDLVSFLCLSPQHCFGGKPINPTVCVFDNGDNLVSSTGLSIAVNLTTHLGYLLEGTLAGDVVNITRNNSCVTFSNVWIDAISGPFRMIFFATQPSGEIEGATHAGTRLAACRQDSCCRIEFEHDGQWGSVCQDGWTDADTIVACRSAGCSPGGGKAVIGGGGGRNMAFGGGTGMIWLDDVRCTGSEAWIGDCDHHPWGTHNCTHDEDVGICCQGCAGGGPKANEYKATCTSRELSSPSCEAVLSLVPPAQALDMRISIHVANSDFRDDTEFVSAVFVGGIKVGSTFLVSDGQDGNCGKMSQIIESDVRWDSLSDSGDLQVRIETSMDVGGITCTDGSTLYAVISVSWTTPTVRHVLSNDFFIKLGAPAKISILTQPSAATAYQIMAPQPRINLQDLGGNLAVDSEYYFVWVTAWEWNVSQKLLGSTTATFHDGIAEFSDLALAWQQQSVVLAFIASFNFSEASDKDNLPVIVSAPFRVEAGKFVAHKIQQKPGNSDCGQTCDDICPKTCVLSNASLSTSDESIMSDCLSQCKTSVGGEPLKAQPIVALIDAGGNLARNVTGSVEAVVIVASWTNSDCGQTCHEICSKTCVLSNASLSTSDMSDCLLQCKISNSSLDRSRLQSALPGGQAVLYGNRFANVNNSIATFTDLVIDIAAQAYALVFMFQNLNPIVSTPFNVSLGGAFRLSAQLYPSDKISANSSSVLVTLSVSNPCS